MNLCCVVQPWCQCKHCKERLCFDHGRPVVDSDKGKVSHFIVNQCRLRYSKEQLVQAEVCAKDGVSKENFRRFRSAKIYGRPGRVRNIKGGCDPCKSYFKGRTDRERI